MADNNWGKMKAAEWRGKVGAKVENIEETLGELCTTVRRHDTELAVLKNHRETNRLSTRAQATIVGAFIVAIASIIVTLIGFLGGA